MGDRRLSSGYPRATHRTAVVDPRRIGRSLLIAALAVIVSGCGIGHDPPPWMDSMHRSMWGDRGVELDRPPSPQPGAPDVVVVATEFAFEPAEVRVRAGETTTVVLDNAGALIHDLTIADLGFQLIADPGEVAAGSFIAAEAGRFEIRCSIPGHAEAGMTALIIVAQ